MTVRKFPEPTPRSGLITAGDPLPNRGEDLVKIIETLKRKRIRCSIEGCKKFAVVVIDDDGVNSPLCAEHMEQHAVWKQNFLKEMDDAGCKR